jgi:glycosyltransferase involved in cell wall biosynthesis
MHAGNEPDAAIPEELSSDERDATCVVIAAFREQDVIGSVVAQLRARYPHVVVVDDGSGDATGERAHAAGATVLTHLINRGQGAALQTGIAYGLGTRARYLVTFDADGQHRVDDIARLVAPLVRGEADVCLGSRFLGDSDAVPAGRRLVLTLAVLFTWITSRMKVTDAHNGLRAFTREAAARLDIQLDRMAHASEILDQVRAHDLRYREIPVRIDYTEYSIAKGQRSGAAFRVALDYLIGRILQ